MNAADRLVNLAECFASFEEHWSPKIVGQVNDMHVKVVKAEGEFVWHSHTDTDELFLVHAGRLTIELEGGRAVHLAPGELYVVPRGARHRPVAEAGCEVVLLEPAGVINTGDAKAGELTTETGLI